MDTKTLIKDMYIDGKSIDDICTTLSIKRQTIYYHKKKDLEIGCDWDKLKNEKEYALINDSETYEANKRTFLSQLFQAFQEQKDCINEIENPIERLKTLTEFGNTFYKLTTPKANDCKGIALKASEATLNIIIDIAIKQKQPQLISFLESNFYEITLGSLEALKNTK